MFMSKRFSRSLVILCAALMLWFGIQPKQADANPLIFGEAALIGTVMLMGAAGIVFSTPAAGRAWATDWLTTQTNDVISTVSGWVNKAGDMFITPGMTLGIDDWITHKVVGTTDGTVMNYGVMGETTGAVGSPVAWSNPDELFSPTASYTTYIGGSTSKTENTATFKAEAANNIAQNADATKSLQAPYSGFVYINLPTNTTIYGMQIYGYAAGTGGTWDYTQKMYYKDASQVTQSVLITNAGGNYIEFAQPITLQAATTTSTFSLALGANTDGNHLWYWDEVEFYTKSQTKTADTYHQYVVNRGDVVLDNTKIGNPGYSLDGRKVTVPYMPGTTTFPTKVEDVIPNTATPAVSEPVVGDQLATQTGILSRISSMVNTIVDTIIHPIGDVNNINWAKLKLSGSIFTTKFPFSLPWDVSNSLSSIFGQFTEGAALPEWDFPVSSGLIGNFNVHLAIPDAFKNWLPYVRGFFLIGGDIALIYSVRKLLGGAS